MAGKKNLANGELNAAITAVATTATLKSGQGTRMPATPFFLTVSPLGEMSTLGNSEVWDVTGVSTDTLTIARAQKGTTAKAFDVNAIVANGIYIEDLLLGASDLTATGGSAVSFLRKDNTWATPTDTNTTYAEIPSAEITAGTALTARAITGRRSQEIVTKAQTGVVKSTTTNRLTISATAPSAPADKDVWYDTSASSTTTLVSQMLDQIYPIGSVYISGSATIPSMIAAIGTWVALEGRVIVGKAATGTFSTVGATGGAETHTLSTAEMPSHSHTTQGYAQIVGGGFWAAGGNYNIGTSSGTNSTGGGGAHNNLQPYKVKYMFERTT